MWSARKAVPGLVTAAATSAALSEVYRPKTHTSRPIIWQTHACACETVPAVTIPKKASVVDEREPTVVRKDLVRFRGNLDDFYRAYELWDELGRGGSAVVNCARDKSTGLLRAVKRVQHASLEKPWQHLQIEVEALTDLDHPCIVRLFEYFDTKTELLLVEELCNGGSVEEFLSTRKTAITYEQAALLLRQMLKAILCCHLHGLVHRDLKADNFMLAERDSTTTVKLIDFGLCHRCQDSKSVAAGTLPASAPEVLRCGGEYGTAADMWSLGVILFQMLTGEHLINGLTDTSSQWRRWFTGESIESECIRKVCDLKYIRDRIAAVEAIPNINADAVDLLKRMLHENPTERINAVHALSHPFIISSYMVYPAGAAVFDMEIIPKFRRFAAAPALKRLAILVEAHILGPHDDPRLSAEYLSFRAIDIDGNGTLSRYELAEALKVHGQEIPNDLDDLCRIVDISGDGSLNLVEFIAATAVPEVYRRKRFCVATFRALDADGDGRITAKDVEKLLKPSERRLDIAKRVIDEIDIKKTGFVTMDQFMALMES